MVRRLSIPFVMLAIALPARAGLYLEAERVPFSVTEAGIVQELPYEPQFKELLDARLTASDPTRPTIMDGKPTPRGELLERLKTAQGLELASLQVLGGFVEQALNSLAPRSRDRVPDFVALVTLAQAHAARGEWPEAARIHAAAFFDAEPPATLPGATPEQTQWLVRVEKIYVKRWLELHRLESRIPREQLVTRNPPELFAGVTFAELGGTEAERAKLPADAVAVVQQLLLWSPGDTGLLWLLGELYAARGDLRTAEKIFDQCTWGRSYTDRPVLMDHRQRTRTAVAALPPEAIDAIPEATNESTPPAEPTPERTRLELLRDYWPVPVGLVVVTVVMLTLQVRAWRRRLRR